MSALPPLPVAAAGALATGGPALPAAAAASAAVGAEAPLAAPLPLTPPGGGGFERALLDAAKLLETTERTGLALDLLSGDLQPAAEPLTRAVADAGPLAELLAQVALPAASGSQTQAPAATDAALARPGLTDLVLGTSEGAGRAAGAALEPAVSGLADAAREARPAAGLPVPPELPRLDDAIAPPRPAAPPAPILDTAQPAGPPADASGGEAGADRGTQRGGAAVLPDAAPVDAASIDSPARAIASLGERRALPQLPAGNEASIIRNVQLLAERGGGRMHIELHPPELGGLQLRVMLGQGGVHVTMLAEHGAVAELLGRNIAELRHSLEAQGLRLDRLEVGSSDVGAEQNGSRQADGRDAQRFDGRPRNRGGELAQGFTSSGAPVPRPTDVGWLGTVDLRV